MNGGAEFDGECANVCLLVLQNDPFHPPPVSSPYELNLTGLAAGVYALRVKPILNGEALTELELSYIHFILTGSGE